jgi:hypothetical protein
MITPFLIVNCQRIALTETDCYSTLVLISFKAHRQKSAAHSSRAPLRGGYKIPTVLKKSRGKANPCLTAGRLFLPQK